jgi:hypothetical protein
MRITVAQCLGRTFWFALICLLFRWWAGLPYLFVWTAGICYLLGALAMRQFCNRRIAKWENSCDKHYKAQLRLALRQRNNTW